MALFRKAKEEKLSEPPAPLSVDSTKGLVDELERVNSIDLSATTTLDGRVRELEAVYKSNKILAKKILTQLEGLKHGLENIHEHEHVIGMEKKHGRFQETMDTLRRDLEHLHVTSDTALQDLRNEQTKLVAKEDLKALQDKVKQGFKEAEERFLSKKRFEALESQVNKTKERLASHDPYLSEVAQLRSEMDTQKEELKRLLELVELLSKKMVI